MDSGRGCGNGEGGGGGGEGGGGAGVDGIKLRFHMPMKKEVLTPGDIRSV